MARWIVLAFAVVVLAGCGSSKKAVSTTAPTKPTVTVVIGPPTTVGVAAAPAKGKLDVVITSSTHLPKVSTPWHYTVRATVHGKPVVARISVKVLYQGTQAADLGSHLRPNGVWAGTFMWPPISRAHMLIVEAKAVSQGRVGTDSYQVAGQ